METILEIIESEDVIALVFLICLLCAIGRKMIEGHPRLRQLSIRFSFLAMIVYCAYTGYLWEAADPVLWSSIVLRGLVAAGLMLGTCWIFLGVLGFLLRIFDGLSAQATARQMERRRKRQQRMDEIEREQRKREYELAAPERERQAQIEAARRRQEEQAKVAEQLDRDGIRYACQLNYSIHAPIIEHRFPQEAVDRFINEYMNERVAGLGGPSTGGSTQPNGQTACRGRRSASKNHES